MPGKDEDGQIDPDQQRITRMYHQRRLTAGAETDVEESPPPGERAALCELGGQCPIPLVPLLLVVVAFRLTMVSIPFIRVMERGECEREGE